MKIENPTKINSNKYKKLYVLVLWILIFLIPSLVLKQFLQAVYEAEREKISISNSKELKRIASEIRLATDNNNFVKTKLSFESLVDFIEEFQIKNTLNPKYQEHVLVQKLVGKIDFSSFLKLKKTIKNTIGVDPEYLFIATNNPKNQFHFYNNSDSNLVNSEKLRIVQTKNFKLLKKKFEAGENAPRKIWSVSESEFFYKSLGLVRGILRFPVKHSRRFSLTSKSVLDFFIFPVIQKNEATAFVIFAIDSSKIPTKLKMQAAAQLGKTSGVKVGFKPGAKISGTRTWEDNNKVFIAEDFSPGASSSDTAILLSKELKTGNFSFIQVCKYFQGIISILIGISFLFLTGYLLERFSHNLINLEREIKIHIFAISLIPIFFLLTIGLKQYDQEKSAFLNNEVADLELFISNLESRFKFELDRFQLLANIVSISIEKTGLEDLSKIAVMTKNFYLQRQIKLPFKNLMGIGPKGRTLLYSNIVADEAVVKLKIPLRNFLKETMLEMGFFKHLPFNEKNKIRQQASFSKEILSQIFNLSELFKFYLNIGLMVPNPITQSNARSILHLVDLNNDKIPDGVLTFFSNVSRTQSSFKAYLESNYPEDRKFKYSFQIKKTLSEGVSEQKGDCFFQYVSKQNDEISSEKKAFDEKKSISFNRYQNGKTKISLTRAIGEKDFMVTAFTIVSPENTMEKASTFIFIGILIAVFSINFLSNIFLKALLLPIPAFQTAIKHMQSEDFSWKIEVNTNDEFSELAKSFNNLASSLHEKKAMSQLVSEDVVELVESSTTELETGLSKRVHATILFADIRNFTTISEEHSPEEVVGMLNDYFTIMIRVIKSYGGRIDKLIGDAIQAVFYQEENQNSVIPAVKAALEMQSQMKKFNKLRAEQNKFVIDNGVGLSYGQVVTGVTGSKTGQIDSAILGRPIKIAQQIEALTKNCEESNILIDSSALHKLGKNFVFKEFSQLGQQKASEKLFAIIGESSLNE